MSKQQMLELHKEVEKTSTAQGAASLGVFKSAFYKLPHFSIINIDWHTYQDLQIKEEVNLEELNLSFMLKGQMVSQMHSINKELIYADRTSTFYFSPYAVNDHIIPANQQIEFFYIAIDRRFFMSLLSENDAWGDRLLKKLDNREPVIGQRVVNPIGTSALQIVQNLRRMTNESSLHNFYIQSGVFELLGIQLEEFSQMHQTVRRINPLDREKLFALKEFIDTHYLEDLNLVGLSRMFALNLFKLKTGFKQLYGVPVFTYIRSLRMHYANQLLHQEELTVADVANIVGYEYPHHFTNAYKKHYGTFPKKK